MGPSLALELNLVENSAENLRFRLLVQNTSREKLLVPRPAITCLRFGNMGTSQEARWHVLWLDAAPWAGFCLESGEGREVAYQVRPSSIPPPMEKNRSEYGRCCVELPAADYLVWVRFEVDQNYVCRDSHYRYADMVWEALAWKAQVWTGQAMSSRLKLTRL